MRKVLLSLLLVLGGASALPVKGGGAGGAGNAPLDTVIWPIGG